jgi:hypothetical protein
MGFNGEYAWLPCGKRLQQDYGKIHHAMKMGKLTINGQWWKNSCKKNNGCPLVICYSLLLKMII